MGWAWFKRKNKRKKRNTVEMGRAGLKRKKKKENKEEGRVSEWVRRV